MRTRISAIIQRLFDWIGEREFPVLIALLAMAIMTWGFIKIASNVTDGDTLKFDNWLLMALRNPDNSQQHIGPAWVGEVARDLTALGGVAFLTLLTLSVSGYLWLRRMYGAMGFLLLAVVGGVLMSTLLKSLYDRDRPDIVPHLSDVYTSSFPSGHSMLAATVYLTLGTLLGRFVPERRFKAYFLIVALMLTGLVGISRVLMGVHYPTDVLAGWIAGLTWAIFCWLVAQTLQRRGAVEQANLSDTT